MSPALAKHVHRVIADFLAGSRIAHAFLPGLAGVFRIVDVEERNRGGKMPGRRNNVGLAIGQNHGARALGNINHGET